MYELEKYKGRDTRYTCPVCGQAHKFTRYINIDDGEYLASYVGKCDREINCGYHFPPRQYFAANGIEQKYTSIAKPKLKQVLPSTHPYTLVDKSRELELILSNSFVLFLNDVVGPEMTEDLVNLYNIGATKDGGVVFWQLDYDYTIRAGKIMYYSKDGHREGVNWIHSKQKIENFNLVQCFFGEHLLGDNKEARVYIVESEKTALIAHAFYPDIIWLAAGSIHGLKSQRKMKVLHGRDVKLYPDTGAFDLWNKIAEEHGFHISKLLEINATKQEQVKGFDLADYLVQFKM